MGLLSWIVFGLIAGAVARWLMPSPEARGIVVTMVIGIAGAVVGGMIGTALGIGDISGFNFGSLVLAILGALVLLFGIRLFRGG